jgi:hypothetical protein
LAAFARPGESSYDGTRAENRLIDHYLLCEGTQRGAVTMAKNSLHKVLQHVRMLAAVHAFRNLPDRELLNRFVKAGDEAALTVLIERHAPMILGVCRRALGNVQDAEDGCQATLLVLARKAASIRKGTSVSGWLHGVACRVAA